MAEEKQEEKKEEKVESKEETKSIKEEKETKKEAKEEAKEEVKEDKNTEEEEVEVPEKFKKLVEEIENMKVADLAELVKILEKKFGVSSAPVAVAAAPVAGEQGAPAGGGEEKNEYNIVLKSIGDKKIEVIKVVRDITGKGLKEAKDLVDAAANEPQTIREKVKKEEAEEMKKKLEAAGATVELQ